MKTLTLSLIVSLLVSAFVSAQAAPIAKKSKVKAKPKLSTEVDFNDRLVGGKYQYASEAITTVENDKILDDLIGVRKHFNDRVQRAGELK